MAFLIHTVDFICGGIMQSFKNIHALHTVLLQRCGLLSTRFQLFLRHPYNMLDSIINSLLLLLV